MNERTKSDTEVALKYYREKIIKTIKSCNDLERLQYLDAFNRLYIDKRTKTECEG